MKTKRNPYGYVYLSVALKGGDKEKSAVKRAALAENRTVASYVRNLVLKDCKFKGFVR